MRELDKPRIVVIDDEPDFLKLVESWLKPYYDVASFSSTTGVVEKIRVFDPDLILLDVHMPDQSGFAVCRRLRNEPGFEDVPVVFLTGSKTDEDFLMHLEAGGSRYLTKPIGRKTLLEALAEQLGGSRIG